MTLDELNAISAREQAATSGRWKCEESKGDDGDVWVVSDSGMVIADVRGNYPRPTLTNGDFIASARQDIPVMVAEILGLRHALSDALYLVGTHEPERRTQLRERFLR